MNVIERHYEKKFAKLRTICLWQEKEGSFQPENLAEDHIGMIKENVTSVLDGWNPSKTIPSCVTLETYEETPISIPIDNT